MTRLDFGWRMATFSLDGSPASSLVKQVEEHLRLFERTFLPAGDPES